jgi:hypothetical protein
MGWGILFVFVNTIVSFTDRQLSPDILRANVNTVGWWHQSSSKDEPG